MAPTFSIIIPTKDRHGLVRSLFDAIKKLDALDGIRPEIIVGDHASKYQTWEVLQEEAKAFPVPLRTVQVSSPGKSAVLNETMRLATGNILVFIDDDITPERGWLAAMERFFLTGKYKAAQGKIAVQMSDTEDAEIQKPIKRYRTIPQFGGPLAVQSYTL